MHTSYFGIKRGYDTVLYVFCDYTCNCFFADGEFQINLTQGEYLVKFGTEIIFAA